MNWIWPLPWSRSHSSVAMPSALATVKSGATRVRLASVISSASLAGGGGGVAFRSSAVTPKSSPIFVAGRSAVAIAFATSTACRVGSMPCSRL